MQPKEQTPLRAGCFLTSKEGVEINILSEVAGVEENAVEDHAVDEPAEEEADDERQHSAVCDQLETAARRGDGRLRATLRNGAHRAPTELWPINTTHSGAYLFSIELPWRRITIIKYITLRTLW